MLFEAAKHLTLPVLLLLVASQVNAAPVEELAANAPINHLPAIPIPTMAPIKDLPLPSILPAHPSLAPPTVGAHLEMLKSSLPVGNISTVKPILNNLEKLATILPSLAPPIPLISSVVPASAEVPFKSNPSTAIPAHIDNNNKQPIAVVDKFGEYLKPICETLDKTQPKQIFKIQSQLKQLVHQSNGKLGFCFLEHYGFNPTIKMPSKEEISNLCQSRNLAAHLKNSYKAFQNCTSKHWDAALDKELDKLIAVRLDHIQNKNETHLDHLSHEKDEENALISDVVSKVFGDAKNLNSDSDFRVIDLSKAAIEKPNLAPKIAEKPLLNVTLKPTLIPAIKNLLTNSTLKPTLVPLMDKLMNNNVTVKPTHAASSTVKPHLIANSTTVLPVQVHISVNITLAPKHNNSTTAKPTEHPAGGLSVKTVLKEVATVKPAHVNGTTHAPVASSSTAAPKNATTTIAPSTTKKPGAVEVLDGVLKKQEKEKSQFDMKLKSERDHVIKQLKKKNQDDSEAQKAIKSLQAQHKSASSHADHKLHQLEHDRQMAMDPIGHTIKHQQYEMAKQQSKAASGH